MGTQHSMLPLLAVTGMMLAGCSEKRPQSTPPDSTLPAAAETPAADSGPAPSGMAAADSTSSKDMMDVTWEWVEFTTPVEQMDIDAPDHYTIRFGSDGKVALRADCNRGMGKYSVTADRKLALKPFALSRAMCPKGSLSDRFAREVGRATSWFLKDGDLFLELPVDSGTLRFRRQT
jgi:heat shock protein HslJ